MLAKIYKKRGKEPYRFTLSGSNGEVLATSEKYNNLGDLEKTLTNYFPDFKVVKQFK